MFGRRSRRRKVLPLGEPEIGAWPEQNFLFGLLEGQPCGMDWRMNHFVQLRGARYVDYRWGAQDVSVTFYPYSIHQLAPNMFDLCPLLEKYGVPKAFVRSLHGKLHEFVVEAIDGGYYLSTFIDQFFRDVRAGNAVFRHPLFIYGYDAVSRIIMIADNFEHGKYGRKEIAYEQLDQGFDLVSEELWEVSVFLYKVKPVHYEFVPDYVREQLEDYLHPGRGLCYFNRTVCPDPFHEDDEYLNEVFFGMDCYDLLDRCLGEILEDNPEYSRRDWRSLAQLCDHKHLMARRYGYMVERGYAEEDAALHERLAELERQCRIAQNMYIKFAISGDTKIIRRLRERMKDIREMDGETVERLLQQCK